MDHSEWADAKKLLDSAPELNYMTQIVFLLFENIQAPKDSKDRYKVEIHFSPGAKGREEIIASGLSASNLGLAHKKHSVPLRRMLPSNVNHRKASHLDVPTIDPLQVKRPAKSLPTLMTQEQLDTVRQVSLKNNLFDADAEEPSIDFQPINGVEPSVAFRPSLSSSSDINIITEELGKYIFYNISCSNVCMILGSVDLATSMKPLKRLCTISLSEMEEFLSNDEMLKEHRSSIGSHRSSIGSQRSSTGSINMPV